MQVTNLNDLKKLLRLCRVEGVTEISFAEVSFKLGEKPQKQSKLNNQSNNTADGIEVEGVISDEDLVYWSSTPQSLSDSQ